MPNSGSKLNKLVSPGFWANRAYIDALNRPILERTILLESSHGRDLGGNISEILRTLCKEAQFTDYTVYVSVAGDMKTSLPCRWSSFTGTSRIRTVMTGSKAYFKILARAEFLINDTSFPTIFVKRKEQLYLNTWHGTPLKTLGRATDSDRFFMGNIQKNFLSADLMLYPNEHTRDIIQKEYMLDNFGTGRMAMTGYPRNEVFFDERLRENIRERYVFGDKRVFVYMPTWRGAMIRADVKAQTEQLGRYLKELDGMLEVRSDICIYVKYHSMMKGALPVNGYSHILPMPDDVPTYDFLQASDGLITDYSSILFDYAVTGRPTILFTYDEADYIRERGITLDMDELPFERVYDVGGLFDKLCRACDDRTSGTSGRLAEFVRRFCPYEGRGVTKQLLADLLNRNLSKYPMMPYNGRSNVVIFGGDFINNGIMTSLRSLMNSLDCDKYNYLILYQMRDDGVAAEGLGSIPLTLSELGCARLTRATVRELLVTKLWERAQKLPFGPARRAYARIGLRDARGIFGQARVDAVIHFTGYGPLYMEAFDTMNCGRAIFVHNDMEREALKSYGMPKSQLVRIYDSYTRVASVSEELTELIGRYTEAAGLSARTVCVPNLIDTAGVTKRSREELRFDAGTESTVSAERLREILDTRPIVNIGRFSPEKGQLRLIDAFEKAVAQTCDGDTSLVILGSYGTEYAKVLARREASALRDRIVVIRYMSNPYPLLARAGLFVLSSTYEGLPVTLMEADILGVPVVSTDIGAGTSRFIREHGGTLVEDSADGLTLGISKYLSGGSLPVMGVDYAEQNKKALESFEALVEEICQKKP